MNLSKRTLSRIGALAATVALATTACTNVTVNPSSNEPGQVPVAGSSMMAGIGGLMHGSASMMDADAMFLQMMIPHHEQAVEMSKLAATNGASPEVLALADTIAGAQGPEIEQMKLWLSDSGRPMMIDDHGMGMAGMVGDADMAELRAAQGPEFDRLYLTLMIAHHEGAIAMAQDVIAQGDDANVRGLADDIIAAQQAEIAQMNAMLAAMS
jgi:uncharacterized protein (DUF305 family)